MRSKLQTLSVSPSKLGMFPVHVPNFLHGFPLQLCHNIHSLSPLIVSLHPEVQHCRNDNHAGLCRQVQPITNLVMGRIRREECPR